MAHYAYLRVSTDAQDVANQRHGIIDYAQRRGFLPLEYTEDTASGAVDWRARSLGTLLEGMRAGDVLIAAEISRIARTTLQVLEIFHFANARKLHVHLVKEGFVMDDSMMSEMMVTIFGALATFERRLIGARTKEALARRKAEGKPLGRPTGAASAEKKLDRRKAEIIDLLGKGVHLASIARIVECSRTTLYTWLDANQLTSCKPEKNREPKPAVMPVAQRHAVRTKRRRGKAAATARPG